MPMARALGVVANGGGGDDDSGTDDTAETLTLNSKIGNSGSDHGNLEAPELSAVDGGIGDNGGDDAEAEDEGNDGSFDDMVASYIENERVVDSAEVEGEISTVGSTSGNTDGDDVNAQALITVVDGGAGKDDGDDEKAPTVGTEEDSSQSDSDSDDSDAEDSGSDDSFDNMIASYYSERQNQLDSTVVEEESGADASDDDAGGNSDNDDGKAADRSTVSHDDGNDIDCNDKVITGMVDTQTSSNKSAVEANTGAESAPAQAAPAPAATFISTSKSTEFVYSMTANTAETVTREEEASAEAFCWDVLATAVLDLSIDATSGTESNSTTVEVAQKSKQSTSDEDSSGKSGSTSSGTSNIILDKDAGGENAHAEKKHGLASVLGARRGSLKGMVKVAQRNRAEATITELSHRTSDVKDDDSESKVALARSGSLPVEDKDLMSRYLKET